MCEVWKWIAVSGAVPAIYFVVAWNFLRRDRYVTWMHRAMRYWRFLTVWLVVEPLALVILAVHC
jgi:hypothetical protein